MIILTHNDGMLLHRHRHQLEQHPTQTISLSDSSSPFPTVDEPLNELQYQRVFYRLNVFTHMTQFDIEDTQPFIHVIHTALGSIQLQQHLQSCLPSSEQLPHHPPLTILATLSLFGNSNCKKSEFYGAPWT